MMTSPPSASKWTISNTHKNLRTRRDTGLCNSSPMSLSTWSSSARPQKSSKRTNTKQRGGRMRTILSTREPGLHQSSTNTRFQPSSQRGRRDRPTILWSIARRTARGWQTNGTARAMHYLRGARSSRVSSRLTRSRCSNCSQSTQPIMQAWTRCSSRVSLPGNFSAQSPASQPQVRTK